MIFRCHSLFSSNVAFSVAFSSFVFNFVSSFSNFSFWFPNFQKRCQGGILLLLYLAPSFPIRKKKFRVFCEEKILSYSAVLGMENIIFLRWLPLKLFMVFLALRYQFSSELQSKFTFQYLLTKLFFFLLFTFYDGRVKSSFHGRPWKRF